MKAFSGGIKPKHSKLTEKKEVKAAKLPKRVVIPLLQHTGAVCKPLVNVNDHVAVGQKIGDSEEDMSALIHASISGVVKEIKEMPHPLGTKVNSVIIESDGKIEWHESVKARDNVDSLSKEELLKIIKEAGIVGLGGAGFPTHVKLNVKDKKIDTLIINGAECEPYLTADHRLMLEQTEKIVKGLEIIKKVVGAEKAIIGVEDNKKDAIALLYEKVKDKNIEIVSLKTRYPQGAEKLLIYSILGRKVPARGLPLDVNVVVNNVGTAKAVHDAVYENKPVIERIVTVTGAVKDPGNFTVRIGVLFKDLIEECNGYSGDTKKIIMGGPMMGIAQETANVPVVKGTTGLLVLDKIDIEAKEPCIKCARCVDACPMLLIPAFIAKFSGKELYEQADSFNALDCFECGCCAYVCPSKIPLVELIKKGKMEIMKKLKKK